MVRQNNRISINQFFVERATMTFPVKTWEGSFGLVRAGVEEEPVVITLRSTGLDRILGWTIVANRKPTIENSTYRTTTDVCATGDFESRLKFESLLKWPHDLRGRRHICRIRSSSFFAFVGLVLTEGATFCGYTNPTTRPLLPSQVTVNE